MSRPVTGSGKNLIYIHFSFLRFAVGIQLNRCSLFSIGVVAKQQIVCVKGPAEIGEKGMKFRERLGFLLNSNRKQEQADSQHVVDAHRQDSTSENENRAVLNSRPIYE